MLKTLFSVLFLSSYAFSGACVDDAGSWGFAGEWLYFMPSFDQSEYLWEGSSEFVLNGTAKRIGENQDFYSGYRLEGNYLFCNGVNDLRVRYTYFSQSSTRSDASTLASQILGIPDDGPLADATGTGFLKRDYNYYAIDGIFNLLCRTSCRFCTNFGAGVKFVHVHVKENVIYNVPALPVIQFVDPQMRAWGLGPVGSFDSAFAVFKGFSFRGQALLGALSAASRSRMTIGTDTTGTDLSLKNQPKLWHVVPTFDVKLGAALHGKIPYLSCIGFDIQGGYEWIKEARIISRITVLDDIAPGYSFNGWSDFMLQGPYVRVKLSY